MSIKLVQLQDNERNDIFPKTLASAQTFTAPSNGVIFIDDDGEVFAVEAANSLTGYVFEPNGVPNGSGVYDGWSNKEGHLVDFPYTPTGLEYLQARFSPGPL